MNLVTAEGRIRDSASQDDLSCIEGVKYKRSDSDTGFSEEREIKIASKLKALELLGKHLGMFNDRLDLNMNQPIVISGGEALVD